MKRWAARSWRQGPIEVQNDLALGITHSAQPQNLSGVSVLDCHEVIHDCSPLTHQLRKNVGDFIIDLKLVALSSPCGDSPLGLRSSIELTPGRRI